jgi:hypothetical protein
MGLSFNDVNIRGSFTWIKCNDDAKSGMFRDLFVNKHGGKFERKNKYWEWSPIHTEIINIDSSQPKETEKEIKNWIFKNTEGKEYKTQNILEFCKEHDLTRSSVYEVISGKRKHHKGFSLVKIYNSPQ